jgi:hypothetical protein
MTRIYSIFMNLKRHALPSATTFPGEVNHVPLLSLADRLRLKLMLNLSKAILIPLPERYCICGFADYIWASSHEGLKSLDERSW